MVMSMLVPTPMFPVHILVHAHVLCQCLCQCLQVQKHVLRQFLPFSLCVIQSLSVGGGVAGENCFSCRAPLDGYNFIHTSQFLACLHMRPICHPWWQICPQIWGLSLLTSKKLQVLEKTVG
jgi:hypothetical protein